MHRGGRAGDDHPPSKLDDHHDFSSFCSVVGAGYNSPFDNIHQLYGHKNEYYYLIINYDCCCF